MRRCGSLLAALVLQAPLALQAEEAPPPRLALTLGVEARHRDNPDLVVSGAQGETTTGLSFGLKSATVTRNQAFLMNFDGVLDGEGLTRPSLGLDYRREGAGAELRFSLQSRQSPVDLSEPVTDETGATIGILAATGEVRQSSGRLDLQTGKDGPLGFSLGLRAQATDYSATTNPSLHDSRSRGVSLGVTAQGAAGRFGLVLAANASRTADAASTARDGRSVKLTWSREIGALSVSASLGDSLNKTRKSGSVTAQSDGLTASLGLEAGQPNGKAGLSFDLGRDAKGARQALRLTREMKLPTGEISAELGYEGRSGGPGTAVGRLAFALERPQGKLSFALSRQMVLDEDDADTVQSSASLGWQQDLGPAASLGLSWRLSAVEGLGDADVEALTRQSLTASYSHDLTQDWAVQAGVTLSRLDRAETGLAEDTSVFVTLGRSFVLLP